MDHHQFRKLREVYPDDPKAAFRPSWKSNDYKIQANKKFREKLQLGPFSKKLSPDGWSEDHSMSDLDPHRFGQEY